MKLWSELEREDRQRLFRLRAEANKLRTIARTLADFPALPDGRDDQIVGSAASAALVAAADLLVLFDSYRTTGPQGGGA